jgi:trans-aconitate 2-methyltransferase
MATWQPQQYLKFGNERTQPARDLLWRIQIESPRRIVDLGCGPGNSTAELRRRWPESRILGLDNSPEMIEAARRSYAEGLWGIADARHWSSAEPVDLIFSNAVLHWIPGHAELCRHLLSQTTSGGALAVQVPAHYDSPLHREILEVSCDPRWSARMHAARTALTNHPPDFYYDALIGMVARVDLWETTYYHVLEGPAAVVDWFRATGLRPFLEALHTGQEQLEFEAALLARYTTTYPQRPDGRILFPFRRLFFVAYR